VKKFPAWIGAFLVVGCAASPSTVEPAACTHDHVEQMLLKTYKATEIDLGEFKARLPSLSGAELSKLQLLLDTIITAHKAHIRNEDQEACATLRKLAAEQHFDIE